MIPDYKPVVISLPKDMQEAEIYFLHDIHYGNENADLQKLERIKTDILAKPNRFVIFVGDYCETAIVNSKSDIYTQTANIELQRLWMQQLFHSLSERILAIVPGNHENRITKIVGLYPVYDAAVCAEVQDKYRQHFAFVDIGVGYGGHGNGKQQHYVGYIAHRIRDCKSYNGSDFVDGIDFCAFGHDHDPKSHPRSKLVYDATSKTVRQKSIKVINCGSFMTYGGYGADAGYRPQATEMYKLILSGTREKKMIVQEFDI